MIVIENRDKTIFLNDKNILDCTFDHETGNVSVRTLDGRLHYYDAVRATYLNDGCTNGVVECKVNENV